MNDAIRVFLVDDSALVRRLLRRTMDEQSDLVVCGDAADGRMAVEMIGRNVPDLVVLDVEMPVMDGITALGLIKKQHPKLPVIMFSTLTSRGAAVTIEALSRGAADYVTKPTGKASLEESIAGIRDDLIPRIRALVGTARRAASPDRAAAAAAIPALLPKRRLTCQPAAIVAIGVSTGGPDVLRQILPALPATLAAPVVVVQHMPKMFTTLLASSLDARCPLTVREAAGGETVAAGSVWIAPGGLHLEVERKDRTVLLKTHTGPPENSCRPAVDVLFRSVAKAYGERALAVVLTGMGSDGASGATHIYNGGGQVLVQNQETSAVWGMPGAVVEKGVADAVLTPAELGREIIRRVAGA
ncbi:MAG: chemotaxis response regulator protein-glutamate methylesterase [Candidatus Schekmanbacteria bacterium]|nr:chemotaxis response regulator protein-glutamate methylesterase [Candidatus Schekmanbacteria bacterium]